ncbi:MAG: nucleoside-diphosphate kinase [Patescibacteria group bacterium]|jgi:nucleoside-diphosphate kinase|nr:nucleoside-diphosphate kinase [bacterium]HQC50000.1 nucleoside-diphosphate kinase [bacterium]
MHLKRERTLVILKPDSVQRGLIGEIIKKIESTGLKLVALKMIMAEEKECWAHYNKDEAWFLSKGERVVENRKAAGLKIEKEAIEYGRDIIEALVKFMTCGPIVAMVWEGNQAIGIVKKLVGSTEPLASDGGTIRGDYTIDSYELSNFDGRAVRNLVHCSDEKTEAEREISIWFTEEEILKYRLVTEQILYDVNLDGIKE